MKRLILSASLLACALLSGCIIVPVHRPGGYHHAMHGDDRSGAGGYAQRGPR